MKINRQVNITTILHACNTINCDTGFKSAYADPQIFGGEGEGGGGVRRLFRVFQGALGISLLIL